MQEFWCDLGLGEVGKSGVVWSTNQLMRLGMYRSFLVSSVWRCGLEWFIQAEHSNQVMQTETLERRKGGDLQSNIIISSKIPYYGSYFIGTVSTNSAFDAASGYLPP